MNKILCSKEYLDFFQKIPEGNISMPELVRHINQSMKPLAEILLFARLTASLHAPGNPIGKKETVENVCLYENGPWEDNPVVREYVTGEHGVVRMMIFPCKGVTWSEEEREFVDFLLKNLYFIMGRARVMGMMDEMAVTDQLTLLPNRVGLGRHCGMLLAQGRLADYSGLFINLKNFKYINKRIGSQEGDILLRKYAEIVSGKLQPTEMYARIGGDNFFALILNEHLQEFLNMIESLPVEVLHGTSTIQFDIGCKAGIYQIRPGDTMNEIMYGSSIAMAAAKASATADYLWYNSSMQEQVVRKKEIAHLFPKALAGKEFIVYYQPKVCLKDNTIYGAEALVRWIREGNMIPPMEFVPILEQEGGICALDFYVLETVCRDLRKWLDAGMEPVCISVNFSKFHFQNRHLVEEVLAVINKYELDSRYIEIEITETFGYEDFDALKHFVNAMREHGIRTSLDDFGTGYSSLNLLKNLNVDIVKLDKSFLVNIENRNKSDDIIVESIIRMVKELNMQVVAEGVETSGQAAYLRGIGCYLAQGFLFDKPLPADDFTERLTGVKKYDKSL